MNRVFAVDLSFPSIGDPVNDHWWNSLSGYSLAIIGLHGGVTPNPAARDWLAGASRAGLVTAAYIAITVPGTSTAVVDKSMNMIGELWDQCVFIALDLEDVWDSIITPDDAREAIDAIIDRGGRPIIYSASWWWDRYWKEVTEFSYLPLWDACYDGRPFVELKRPYGGWTSCVGKQYDGTARINGVKVDLSVFSGDWLDSVINASPDAGENTGVGTGEATEMDKQAVLAIVQELEAHFSRIWGYPLLRVLYGDGSADINEVARLWGELKREIMK